MREITTALQFSGGKDSLACLHLYREQWNDIMVCWVNTGAAYPETIAFMERWKARLPHFLEVKSNQPAQILRDGYPTEVIPLNLSPFGRSQVLGKSSLKLQSHFGCCMANIWAPMHNAMTAIGITRIIRGQRKSDRRKAQITNGTVDANGIEYVLPIESWSNMDVLEYLERVGAELPDYYLTERTSRDCWDCTAYLDESAERIRGLTPERREEVERRLRLIREAVEQEMAPLVRVLEVA